MIISCIILIPRHVTLNKETTTGLLSASKATTTTKGCAKDVEISQLNVIHTVPSQSAWMVFIWMCMNFWMWAKCPVLDVHTNVKLAAQEQIASKIIPINLNMRALIQEKENANKVFMKSTIHVKFVDQVDVMTVTIWECALLVNLDIN